MCPDRCFHSQRGAGLPVALFIITVLALLVVGMAQLQESSGRSVSLQIQSQRAFFAAESGAQVGVAQALAAGACGAVTSPKTFSTGGLSSCRAQVSCSSVSADIEGNSALETVFSITSVGQCGSGFDQAERVVEVRVR
ncbi:MAG: hypothetical protein R3280_11940 [Marinobacter sp.]|uniref:pilus assembly PilX family protein n=1 Tax=Marinobacter sp. TaxID=50741 RepID=UPI00299DD463|nr:hypothetical protein [Marinobacter sp.]MDX1635343.1 hypothetical protein [Marinobacter sp.]